MKNLKVIFMGTPDFACNPLSWLIENTNVCLVVTKPDKEIGRNHEIVYSPVKKLAMSHNISIYQPIKIKNDYEIISEINPDIIITCAYGQIIPEEILNIPRLGCINIHASILPKYRGAAPIQWALINGDKETGVTLMYMDKNMDTGDIISIEKCPIEDNDDIGSLHDKLSQIGTNILKNNLESIINKTNDRTKQDNEKATYAKMIEREDELLNFNDTCINIYNKIRAFSPWPLTYFKLGKEEIKVVKAHFENKKVKEIGNIIYEKKTMGITCQDGIIYFDIVKPFGKKEMSIESFLNGCKKDITYV